MRLLISTYYVFIMPVGLVFTLTRKLLHSNLILKFKKCCKRTLSCMKHYESSREVSIPASCSQEGCIHLVLLITSIILRYLFRR